MPSFSIRAWTWALITAELREVTTPTSSRAGGGGGAARAWVTSVGSRSGCMGSGAPHAVARARARVGSKHIDRGGRIGRLRGEVRQVLGRLDQACVQAVCGHELVVIALLDDPALVHHDDQVGV